MNNLLSYCGLTDARMRASEKYLPVLFKLISSPIHWIVCVLAYLNFIFEFWNSFSTAQNCRLFPDIQKYKFHLNCLQHSICISLPIGWIQNWVSWGEIGSQSKMLGLEFGLFLRNKSKNMFKKIEVLGSVKIVFVFCSKLYFTPSIIVHKSVAKLLKLPQNTTGKWHKQGITQSSTKLITVFL